MAAHDPKDVEGAARPSPDEIREWLREVPDPEIPVISVIDLGIIRDVAYEDETLVVAVTPTYSGCPATAVIAFEIERHLREKGIDKLRLEQRLSPPWTTDWIGPEAREKLRTFGIAPPIDGTAIAGMRAVSLLDDDAPTVPCPRCGSKDTGEISRFGSTPCKAQWRCQSCLEPFDHFKCI